MQRALTVLVLLSTVACATPHLVLPGTYDAERVELAALLAAHPLKAGENIRAVTLGRTQDLSYHLIQIRDREAPHVHARHDVTVALLQGAGTLYVRGRPHAMKAGDVAVVLRGTPHYFVNTQHSPAVAFVTFAPPYAGKDQVPAEQ